jgi:hypothetical protein
MALDGPTVLVTVTLPKGATLQTAMERLDLAPDEVDTDYGLVPVDPDRGTFVLLVTEPAGRRVGSAEGAAGPFANPRIEPFGPPQ